MKALIYLACIAAAAAIQTALRMNGMELGGLVVALLYGTALLFAAEFCKPREQKKKTADAPDAGKGPFPHPGEKICGTPFIRAGWETEKRPGRTRLEIGLSVVCAVLVLLSAVLGCKAYEFRKLAITSIQENERLLQEKDELLRENDTLSLQNDVLRQYCRYVASIDSNRYHLPSCPYANNILPKNRIEIDSALGLMIMENRGYVPCSLCLP